MTSPRRILSQSIGAFLLLAGVSSSSATVFLWDGGTTSPTGTLNGQSNGGNGNWSTSVANWESGGAYSVWPSAGTDNDATFGGIAGTVTLVTPISVNDILFTTTGYTIAGGGANALTLNGAVSNVTVGTGLSATIGAPIVGGSLTKVGQGLLTLNGANSYTGATAVQNGTLRVGTTGTMGATAVTLGTGTAGTIGTVGNLTIENNVGVGAVAFRSNTSDLTTAANIAQLSISSGKTLTATSFGAGMGASLTQETNTAVATSGGGNLTVNGVVTIGADGVAGATNFAGHTAVDLSGLSSFTNTNTSGTFKVGGTTQNDAALTLASVSNAITVSSLGIGNGDGNNNQLAFARLFLGGGTNVLQANTISIGGGKAYGTVQFAGATGSVTIGGTAGGAALAAIDIANQQVGGTKANSAYPLAEDALLLAGHTATVKASTVLIGNKTNGAGTLDAKLTFDTGTFDAASITMGQASGTTATGAVNAVLTVGGATSGSAATGVFTVTGSLLLSNNSNTTAPTRVTTNGNLIINGGTVNLNTAGSSTGGLRDTSTGGTSTTSLTLDGGTLNLNGGVIGGNGASGNRAITNLNLQSGMLMNVSQINGGGTVTKSDGAGTLTLAGTNSYTGGTVVDNGILLVSGSLNGTSNVNVRIGGTLGGTGTISPQAGTATDIYLEDGAKLAPGLTGAGTLHVTLKNSSARLSIGDAVYNNASEALLFDLGSINNSDRVQVTGGALSIDSAGFSGFGFDDFVFTLQAGIQYGQYTLFDTNSAIAGSLDTASPLSGLLSNGYIASLEISADGQDIILNVVPEPSAGIMLLATSAVLLGLRRRPRAN